jgi:hypothetical protein
MVADPPTTEALTLQVGHLVREIDGWERLTDALCYAS